MSLNIRDSIAQQYISGDGIEVGALHGPLPVPHTARVRYLDRLPVSELRRHYPELAQHQLVDVDIIDDGETLYSIADGSLDFVIANHTIEHCQNPIGTIKQNLRVLKSGGIIYMAVPDKRYTFDRDRPLTPLDHLIRDYTDGPEWSKKDHYEEWVNLVQKAPEKEVEERVQHLLGIDYSIHFHVWEQSSFIELLLYCQQKLNLPFDIELIQKNEEEFICILRKLELPVPQQEILPIKASQPSETIKTFPKLEPCPESSELSLIERVKKQLDNSQLWLQSVCTTIEKSRQPNFEEISQNQNLFDYCLDSPKPSDPINTRDILLSCWIATLKENLLGQPAFCNDSGTFIKLLNTTPRPDVVVAYPIHHVVGVHDYISLPDDAANTTWYIQFLVNAKICRIPVELDLTNYTNLISLESAQINQTTGIRIGMISDCPAGSYWYRVLHQAELLRNMGFSVDTFPPDVFPYEDILKNQYNIVIAHRQAHTNEFEQFVLAARQGGTKVLYSTDDLVFDPFKLEHNDAYRSMSIEEKIMYKDEVKRCQQALSICDGAIVTTEKLGSELINYLPNKPILVSRNLMSSEMEKLAMQARLMEKIEDGLIRIAYFSGTKTHQKDFAECGNALLKIMSEFPQVRLMIVGLLDIPDSFEQFKHRIDIEPYREWQELPKLYRIIDINLAPLEQNNEFTECKSELKYFEAGIMSIPTVASDVIPFQVAIQHGQNGYLCRTTEDWANALRELILNPELRETMGQKAWTDVHQKYLARAIPPDVFHSWYNLFQQLNLYRD
ncbi:glycosyltransferase [Microcoleus sp. Z1_B2]|uniref:glycosyltransferase n=1 Tax=Microcoleus sp. Z1_B2 TaxID=3055429 RepID=UPI002FCEAEE9